MTRRRTSQRGSSEVGGGDAYERSVRVRNGATGNMLGTAGSVRVSGLTVDSSGTGSCNAVVLEMGFVSIGEPDICQFRTYLLYV